MWPDEGESFDDETAYGPSSGVVGGGGGGGGSSNSGYRLSEGRASGGEELGSAAAAAAGTTALAAGSAATGAEGGGGPPSGEEGVMGADGGLREEWELMRMDEKVKRVCCAGVAEDVALLCRHRCGAFVFVFCWFSSTHRVFVDVQID